MRRILPRHAAGEDLRAGRTSPCDSGASGRLSGNLGAVGLPPPLPQMQGFGPMRATVERSHLLKSLGHVHRVVERRNTIPILSNVLLRADGARLLLKATDLDVEITETVPADVGQAGATTVPAQILFDIVRKLPDGAEVSLDTGDGSQLSVRSGRSKFTLQVLSESDFPDLATGDFTARFTLT